MTPEYGINLPAIQGDNHYAEQQLWMVGEKQLLSAMLQDAILCLTFIGHEKPSEARKGREALEWFKEKADDVFSLTYCCEALGLDPQAVRSKYLARVKNATVKKITRARIVIPPDPKASHEYVHMKHCKECNSRYNKAYWREHGRSSRMGRPPITLNAQHAYLGQKHCKDCRLMWEHDYKERMNGGNPTIDLKQRGRRPGNAIKDIMADIAKPARKKSWGYNG